MSFRNHRIFYPLDEYKLFSRNISIFFSCYMYPRIHSHIFNEAILECSLFIHSLINSLTFRFELLWIFTPLDRKIHNGITSLATWVFIFTFWDCFLKILLYSVIIIIIANKIDFERHVLLILSVKTFSSIKISTSKTALLYATYNTWLLSDCGHLRVYKMFIPY